MSEARRPSFPRGAGSQSDDLEQKVSRLCSLLREIGPVLVAFSGGVDSATLLHVAGEALGREGVLAVTVQGDVHTGDEVAAAVSSAERMQVRHVVLTTSELRIPGFAENPPDRCYLCKAAMLAGLTELARKYGMETVVDGANADDVRDYRPGMRAIREAGARSPMAEVGFTKAEIRALARERGLVEWDKPSSPCLASRFPYGQAITSDALAMVAQAEAYLHGLGFGTVRVRHHGDLARIELAEDEIVRAVEVGERCASGDDRLKAAASVRRGIVEHLHGLGYTFVTLDLQGFRSGSLNQGSGLPPAQEETR